MSLALFSSASTSRIVFTGVPGMYSRTTRRSPTLMLALDKALDALTSLPAGVRDADGAIAAELFASGR
eukprot:6622827-Prymnesium_polylepis.1